MLNLDDKNTTGPAIRLNSADNVSIALSEISSGTTLPDTNIVTREIIPPGYKIAIDDIPKGDPIKNRDSVQCRRRNDRFQHVFSHLRHYCPCGAQNSGSPLFGEGGLGPWSITPACSFSCLIRFLA